MPGENQWIFTFSDGEREEVAGPAIPAVSGSLESTSNETAASSAALRTAYLLASAAMAKGGGTFTGAVYAAVETPSESLLRNTSLTAAEMTPGSDGEICWQYE